MSCPSKGTLLRYIPDGRMARLEQIEQYGSTHGVIEVYVAVLVQKKGKAKRIVAAMDQWEIISEGSICTE